MRTIVSILFFGIFLMACSRPKETNTPSEPLADPAEGRRIASIDVIKASAEPVAIAKGATGEAHVRLSIEDGFHVNANPPTFAYLKPTELELKPEPGFSVSDITYPDALTKKFQFSEEVLAVYEGEVVIKVRFKADRSVASGQKNLSGLLRVQACDDRVCYPPGVKDISIPVDVK